MTPAEIQISLTGGIALALLVALGAAGAAWLSYRRTVPPLPPGRRALLTALRAAALVAVALLLAEPVVRFVETRIDPPVVALLVDDTESIRMHGEPVAEAVRAFVSGAGASAPAGAALRYFRFASSVAGATPAAPDSLPFAGQSTNLSAALAEIRKRAREENIRAVVLASDGNYNEGRNPINDVDLLGIPVYAAGAGDTTRKRDLVVDRVFTNAIAYAGSSVPVEAHLRSFGFRDARVEMSVRGSAGVVARSTVALSEGRSEYPVSFTIPAEAEGVHRYTVSAGSLPGELTRENNAQTFFIRVLRSRLRVVMFAGSVYPDVAALRLAVAGDPQMEIRSFVQKSPGAFIEGPPSQGVLDSADCFLFAGFPSRLTSDRTVAEILAALRKGRRPLFTVHGTMVDHGKLSAFDEFLPFTMSAPGAAVETVFPSVPQAMRNHPLVDAERTGTTIESWERLPPVFKVRTKFASRPGSEVLAYAKINNVTLTEPLVLSRNVRGAKSFAVTGHGVYRWRLLAQGSPATDRFFVDLVSNAVRWLTTRADERPLRVEPIRETFTTADGTGFRAEVYDEQLRPVDDAEVTVRFAAGGREYAMALDPIGSGRYEGSGGPVPDGDYTFRAEAVRAGRRLGSDDGRFSVGRLNVEYLATTMNRRLLEQIGTRSGGGFYALEEADRLWKDLSAGVALEPREEVERTEIELWNSAWLGAVLVLLLGLEWLLRKRWALL